MPSKLFNLQRLVKSFRHAFHGLQYAWRAEQNFRIQVIVAIAVFAVALYFKLSVARVVVLVMMSVIVLALELLNTFFEKLVDLLSPRLHYAVGVLKDLLAAAVLVSSLGALIVGFLIFWPYLSSTF
ncbi:hypothetical protein A3H10_01710 [Candidatus Uhrbacteria bacterium RIFCSPLOWO2_12_FULL_46_10]|uniref:Diacylglycerol kinase n=1 Tax=Candidatus Uhrbacteria bacterium RIFCSPLOWO2_01_FULL_47_25 TaxID=1802402 RepID=A0A1F7UWV9_9BACT|nr:MAG: Diacylglycerol kinase [Parcubacteria group bacterium GW2011_GWA2_46_9]OGL60373.1 MAG: hypothetical protein A2752_01980 [Candidatus Uhrbacteria bacterium RIFCSPHIGHO2_01_FULL_46_23]OGL69774.1 MAG: hypothetical protein A3D60_01405 [Candidatus Uhrbacteria bacterium RIFCSPHIGHO2_02_FULL_47_29]OGL75368.1 MAG: hypothetical protein A3E96_04445 [Candidatus Uhrbacteria bacterium RIFCSPHIGHO2_12_FULL_46_13]OGL82759.1 MAG: hypothetical protein A2936_04415 [Candidatus Uhrbacteria bacterium RIFCSPLO